MGRGHVMHLNSFIFANIYILLIADILIFLMVLYISLQSQARQKRLASCRSRYEEYLKDAGSAIVPADDTLHLYAACEAAGLYHDTDPIRTSSFIKDQKLDTRLISLVKKHPSLYRLKLLALLRSPEAFATFMELTGTLHDRTALYTCFYGLALSDNKNHSATESLLSSPLATDRKVELLALMKPVPGEYLDMLEKTGKDTSRIILLRVICDTDLPSERDFYDRILPFLEGTHEVRIAAVNALSSSHIDDYLPQLVSLYHNSDSWQLRTVLASAMSRFSPGKTKDILIEMTHDTAWWVRYNAVLSLSKYGNEGLSLISELSKDQSDSKAAGMAAAYLSSVPSPQEVTA